MAALTHAVASRRPVEVWGDGQAVRDFVYVGDVAEALVLAASYVGPRRVFNVGSGVGRSVLDVVRDIGAALGQANVPVVHKPGRVADVPANVLDTGLIQSELGWTPRMPWMDALRLTAAWLRQAHLAG